MHKRSLAFAFMMVLAVAVSCSVTGGLPAARASAPTVSIGPTTFTTSGYSVLNLTPGQNLCTMVITGLSGAVTLMPYRLPPGSSSLVYMDNIGTKNANGTYSGTIDPTNVAFVVQRTVPTGGSVTIWQYCSYSAAPTPTPSPTPTPTPGPTPTPTPSPTPAPTPTPMAGIVTFACPSAMPAAFPTVYGVGPTSAPLYLCTITSDGRIKVVTQDPVQPSPLYTSPVHDAAPVQPSPLYTSPVSVQNPVTVHPDGTPFPISGSVTAIVSPSPAATFSPFPGGAVVLTGPSTAPAASAGVYAVCVDSSGKLCVQTPVPTFTGNQTVSGTVSNNCLTNCTPNPAVTQQIAGNVVTHPDGTTAPVSTPSAGPAPTASAGAAFPSAAVQVLAQILCAYTTGTVSITAGNTYTARCDSLGNLTVTFPSSQPVSISNTSPMPVTTGAPVTQASSVPCDGTNCTGAFPVATQSAQPSQTSIPTLDHLTVVDRTDGKYWPVNGCGANTAGVAAGCTMNVTLCQAAATSCAIPTSAPADATSNATGMQPALAYPMVFNGTTWDRQRKCTSTASGTINSATTTSMVAASGSTTIYICAFAFSFVSGTAVSAQIVYGTGATCGTGTNTMVPATLLPATGAFTDFSSFSIMQTPASQVVCVTTGGSSTPTLNWTLWFTQQ